MKISKSDWIFLVFCLILGIVAEESFLRAEIGVSYLVFTIVFYLVFLWRYRTSSFTHQRFGYLLLICIWLLSASYFFNHVLFFNVLNILVIPGLMIFHLILITSQQKLRWNKPEFVFYFLLKIVAAIKYNFRFIGVLGNFFRQGMEEDKYQLSKKVFIGVLVSIPVLFVVLQLLMSADSQFERLIGGIPKWLQFVDAEIVFRIMAIFIFTFAFFGFIQVLFQKQMTRITRTEPVQTFQLDAIISITVLVIINSVYVLFTIVQFKYFFSGTLLVDFTFAEYARKGFFELLFVTIINLSIIVVVLTFVGGIHGMMKRIKQLLLTILILSSAIMLSSAFIRLSMYEDAYGFTFIRLMAHSFMIFLAVIFMYTLVKIWMEKLSLFHFYFICSLLYYTTMNMIDVEKMIVMKNFERYEESGKIDIHYLNSLTYTGVIGLIELYSKDENIPGLKEILIERKNLAKDQNSAWQSYNLKREQANERLSELQIK
jgi:hypothetical protein